MSFYKKESDILMTAPTSVVSCNYELLAEYHTTYNLPIDGWYWFDTEEEANVFFGITQE